MRLNPKKRLAGLVLLCISTPALATIDIKFVESAPKDWFALANSTECPLTHVRMDVDLSSSAGKLIFDTTASGAGVEVFQPFEVRDGNVTLHAAESVNDGDTQLSVIIENLAPGETASFTIDVDDTLTNSELGMIRVSKSEITGSVIKLTLHDSDKLEGSLDNDGKLQLKAPSCQ